MLEGWRSSYRAPRGDNNPYVILDWGDLLAYVKELGFVVSILRLPKSYGRKRSVDFTLISEFMGSF